MCAFPRVHDDLRKPTPSSASPHGNRQDGLFPSLLSSSDIYIHISVGQLEKSMDLDFLIIRNGICILSHANLRKEKIAVIRVSATGHVPF